MLRTLRLQPYKSLYAHILLLGLCMIPSPPCVQAHRCYICGPLHHGYNQTCDQFESNLASYEADCPDKHNACSTQYHGVNTTRQCEAMAKINDCKVANGIKYCYCSSLLCNGVNELPNILTDDEDMLSNEAGSGVGVINNNILDDVLDIVGGRDVDDGNGTMIAACTSCSLLIVAILLMRLC